MSCDFCGAAVAPRVLVCTCGRLAYGKRVATLAGKAEGYEQTGAANLARTTWQEALGYLPVDSGQAKAIAERIEKLGAPSLAPAAAPAPTSANASGDAANKKKGIAGVLGAIGVALLKFKTIVFTVLFKLKFLLKAGKFIPSFLSMGLYVVYACVFMTARYGPIGGLYIGLGFTLMIWIHEMGHNALFYVFGIPFDWPTFVPGFGAFVRAKAQPRDASEQAWISLGGPLVGAVGAVGALGLGELLDSDVCRIVGQIGVWLNLFNLIPFAIFDGARAIYALDLGLWLAGSAIFTMAALSGDEPWLGLVCLLALPTIWSNRNPAPGSFHDIPFSRRIAPSLVLITLAPGLLLIHFALSGQRHSLLKRTGHEGDIASVDSSLDDPSDSR